MPPLRCCSAALMLARARAWLSSGRLSTSEYGKSLPLLLAAPGCSLPGMHARGRGAWGVESA